MDISYIFCNFAKDKINIINRRFFLPNTLINMVTNNVNFIKNYFHQASPDIDAEEVIKQFCKNINQIPEHLDIFHMDMFMTPTLDGIIYTITLVSDKPIYIVDLDDVHRWAYEIFPDEDIISSRAVRISKNIMQVTLSITFNDEIMMGDLITILELIQKMEQGNLIPTSQVESLARELFSVMDNKLTAGVMKTFQDLLDQVNSNKDNSLFIDIM